LTSKREQFYKRRIAELEAQLKQRDQRFTIYQLTIEDPPSFGGLTILQASGIEQQTSFDTKNPVFFMVFCSLTCYIKRA
jgi:hypothetical protein